MNSSVDIPRRDEGIQEAINHLNRYYEKAGGDSILAWTMFTASELSFVEDQIKKCKADFRYYAGNYHVVATKSKGLTCLNSWWDSQEIFFYQIVKIRTAGGRVVKIICLKSRQLGLCLDPKTKVLTADLRWIPIEEVKIGQELVSVDEGMTEEEFRAKKTAYAKSWKHKKRGSSTFTLPFDEALPSLPGQSGKRPSRKLRRTKVLGYREVHERAFRITMASGHTLVATGPHRFLSKVRGGSEPIWKRTDDFKAGDEIRYVTRPWGEAEYEDGWFSGLLDGEGSLALKIRNGANLGVAQVAGPVLDRAVRYLENRGYTYRAEVDRRKAGENSKLGNKEVHKLIVSRIDQVFRLIGHTRPSRFLNRDWWEGKEMPGKRSGIGWEKIVSIEPLPAQRMIDIQTSTKTFIAEGFVSHNSTISQALGFYTTIFTESCNTLVVGQDPDQADYLFSMSRTAYDSLPFWMRPESRYDAKGRYLQLDRKDELERTLNPGLRSNIFVAAANKLTGVSVGKGIRVAMLSELSDWEDAGKTLAEHIFPAMEGSTDLLAVMESTARGRGGRGRTWYEFWKGAVRGENDWVPVFIEAFRVRSYSIPISNPPFLLTPEEEGIRAKVQKRTNAVISDEFFNWRRNKIQEFIQLQGDDSKFFQEYCLSWTEAFTNSGLCAFDKKRLHSILDTSCCDPLLIGEIFLEKDHKTPKLLLTQPKAGRLFGERKTYGDRLFVWELPEESESYYIGGDVAMGNGGDYSVAQVIRIGRGGEPDFQVAEWHGWISPVDFAHVLAALGYWYNTCQVAQEINDVGQKTNMELFSNLSYPNCYRWRHYDKIKNFLTNYMGWKTTHASRPLIIVGMQDAINKSTTVIRSEQLIEEMLDFAADYDGGRYEGQDMNDDLVMSYMIANHCAHDSDWGKREALRSKDPRRESIDMSIRQRTEYSPIYSKPGDIPFRMATELDIPPEHIGGVQQEVGIHEGAAILWGRDEEAGDEGWKSM